MDINNTINRSALSEKFHDFFNLSGYKIKQLLKTWDPKQGTPVFTVDGRYTTKGWTEWTQGFLYGWSILQFDATDDEEYLQMGRVGTLHHMAPHLSHTGVHDHGFNNISTYGNLHRLMAEKRIPFQEWEQHFYELALKVSGAVQASRWSKLADGTGFIHSFNGPHSLFIDTIRSLRSLAAAYKLGHCLMGEGDEPISLLERLIQHSINTAKYNIYYGEGRDSYDVRGRVAHEAIFNMSNGVFRCPNSQQGYSPFSTWTRGLAWAVLGYAELLEFLSSLSDHELSPYGGREEVVHQMEKAAMATADFYIENTAVDGIPYWDTGAPGLRHLSNWREQPADPNNDFEPVDSSAAAIAAQGLARLGKYLDTHLKGDGARYVNAALCVSDTLFGPVYLAEDETHQGLLKHVIYHRPNGWDHTPEGSGIPKGESALWGDYHLVELALYIKRLLADMKK